jgi:hypothetical protein
VTGPSTSLNHNQQVHLATFLRLLIEDVARLREDPGLPARVVTALDAVSSAAQRVADEFGLSLPREADPLHRVRVVAEVWITRAHGIRAARLRGYGPVDPNLGKRLDPLVGQLRNRLEDLASAVANGEQR